MWSTHVKIQIDKITLITNLEFLWCETSNLMSQEPTFSLMIEKKKKEKKKGERERERIDTWQSAILQKILYISCHFPALHIELLLQLWCNNEGESLQHHWNICFKRYFQAPSSKIPLFNSAVYIFFLHIQQETSMELFLGIDLSGL